jgi:hypothetical protein
MKKIALAVAGILVLLIAGGLFFASTQVDRLVAGAIETYGRAATGTAVNVGNVDVALTEGRGRLAGLTIDNPDGYSTRHFLEIDDVDLALDLASLRGVPVAREVVVDAAHLNAEQRGSATNLTDIQSYMSKAPADAPAAGEPGRLIIDRFRLTNARVTVTSDVLEHPEELTLADVQVDGIGRANGGATYGEATEAILTPIVAAARSAVESRLRSRATDAVKDELRDRASERLDELRNRD